VVAILKVLPISSEISPSRAGESLAEQGGREFPASIQAFSASVMRLIPTTNSRQPRSCEARTLRPWRVRR
jgi:hypothetical protein